MPSRDDVDPVRPNYSLREFVRIQIASDEEWAEFLRVQGAAPPRGQTTLEGGRPIVTPGAPSPEFTRCQTLEKHFRERLRQHLLSGSWQVRAIARGQSDRQTVAPDLLARATQISFLEDRIGTFTFVEIAPLGSEDRYLRIKWFIEQFCAVVPPKHGITKAHVQDLAERLLPFQVTDDLFKPAWREADIAPAFRKPGK